MKYPLALSSDEAGPDHLSRRKESGGWVKRWLDVYRLWWGEKNGSSIIRWEEERDDLLFACVFCVQNSRLIWLSHYQIILKKNKVNCWLFMVTLRLYNLACLKELFICLCFNVCFMLRIYQQICQRNGFRKRDIRTWMSRRIPEWKTVGRSIGRMFLRMVTIIIIWIPWCGRSTLDRSIIL